MKQYLTKIRNGSLKESEMQAMFDELSKDSFAVVNTDRYICERWYREKLK